LANTGSIPARDPYAFGMMLDLSPLDTSWKMTFELAWEAWRAGTIPIGAVLTDDTGTVIASGRNRIFETALAHGQLSGSWVAHAEVNALAQLPAGSHDGYTITSTTEPCLLCAGAITMSLHGRIVVRYAVDDPIAGGMEAARMAPQGRRREFVVERLERRDFVVLVDAMNLAESVRRSPDGIVATYYQANHPDLFAAAADFRNVLEPLLGTDAPLREALQRVAPIVGGYLAR
jgi:tRNA(Arg) A34 adenosine deaminase TadA